MSWVTNIPYTYRQWRQVDAILVQLYHKKLLFFHKTYDTNAIMFEMGVHKWESIKKQVQISQIAKYFAVPIATSPSDYCASWTAWLSPSWIPINCSQTFESSAVICQFADKKRSHNTSMFLERSKAECSLDAFAISSYCIMIQEIASSGTSCPDRVVIETVPILYSSIYRRYMGLHKYKHIGVGGYSSPEGTCRCYVQSPYTLQSASGEEPLHQSLCTCKQLGALICASFKSYVPNFKRYLGLNYIDLGCLILLKFWACPYIAM